MVCLPISTESNGCLPMTKNKFTLKREEREVVNERIFDAPCEKEKYMNPSERIDKQIAELADWRGQMIARLRKLIREADPDITEEWKWDTAVWSHRGLVCAVGAFKQTVKMNFFQGALLEDPQKLFNAGLDAKKTRAIDFREGDAVDESALKELIRAAVAHNVGGKIG